MESVQNQQHKYLYYWPSERDEILNLFNGNYQWQWNALLETVAEFTNNTTYKEERYLNLATEKKSILKTEKQEESKLLRGISSKKVSFKLPENKTAIRTQKPSRIPILIRSKLADNVHKSTSTDHFKCTNTPVIKSTDSTSNGDLSGYADQITSTSQSSCFKVNDTTYKEIEQRTNVNTTAEKRSILKKQVPEEYKHLPFNNKPSAKRVSFKLPENEISSRTQKPSRIPILIRSKLERNRIREPVYTKISTEKAARSSCLSQSSATDGALKHIPADNIHNTKSKNSTPTYPNTSTASPGKSAVESHQKKLIF